MFWMFFQNKCHISASSFELNRMCIFLLLCSQAAIIQDFHTLRAQAERDGLFRAQPLFFCLHLGHILLLEALAWLIIWLWGTSWTLTFLCSIMLAVAQVTRTLLSQSQILLQTNTKTPASLLLLQSQAGWLQHDFGHLSVFKKSSWNHMLQKFVIGHLKVICIPGSIYIFSFPKNHVCSSK